MTLSLENGPTRFGIFQAPFHVRNSAPAVNYQRDLELIELADKLGLQEAWVGEHHTGSVEPIGCPELFLAAAAERTQQIMLGTGVNSLPYHNPFTLASRLTQLDHMSRGRVIFGFGPGQLASDAHILDIDTTRQRAMMLESARVITRLMRGEWVTEKTDWFSLKDAHLQVLPYQLPTMEMVTAATISPTGPKVAGELGLGMINFGGTSQAVFDAVKDHWAICEAEAEKHGTTVSRENWRMSAICHLADTEEQAREDCRYGFEQIWGYLGEISVLPVSKAESFEALLDEAIDSGSIIIGTPDTLIEKIRELAQQTGGFGAFIMTLADFADFPARRHSVELFANRVVPEFRGYLAALRKSQEWVLGQHDDEGATVWKTQTLDAIAKASKDYDTQRGATPAGA
jgi:limonene 1,2-monooxygenase